MSENVYYRKPIDYHNSIPIFSLPSEYIENYERISADHLKTFHETGKNPFIKEDIWLTLEESTLELVRKYSRNGDMVLDAGVGLGRLLSFFPQLKRYGMDISLGYLQEAQSKGIEVSFSLIEDMPYKSEIFDIVICTDVLEHVIDLNLSIKKILKTLKRNGILIIRVPYRENLLPYFDAPYRYIHLRNFDEHSLRLLLEKVFGCEYLETTFGAYVPYREYLKWQIPYLQRLIYPFYWITSKISMHRADEILRRWYHPIDMNLVVRKCG